MTPRALWRSAVDRSPVMQERTQLECECVAGPRHVDDGRKLQDLTHMARGLELAVTAQEDRAIVLHGGRDEAVCPLQPHGVQRM